MEVLVTKQKQKKTASAVRRPVMTGRGQHAAVRSVLRNAKIQPKLQIGQVNDKYEREADRVAEQVMSKPAPPEKQAHVFPPSSQVISFSAVQKDSEPIGEEELLIQPFGITPQLSAPVAVQRQVSGNVLNQLADFDDIGLVAANAAQRKSKPASEPSVASHNSANQSDNGPPGRFSIPGASVDRPSPHETFSDNSAILTAGGQPLPASLRLFYEERFGRDFSEVRVHTGPQAAQKNDELNSFAFTHANHIWLGENQRLESSALLAHELTHVVQQTQPGLLQGRKHRPESPLPQPLKAGRRVQRFGPFWEPKHIKNGQVNHNKILPVMGKENSVFTEAPVPNADRLGSALEGDKKGEADIYGASNTVGLRWEGHENPKHLNARGKIKKNGHKYKDHDAKSGPHISKSQELMGIIDHAADAPAEILIADLKPSEKTIEASKGVDQVNYYKQGFLIARDEYNQYAAKYPHRVTPNGQKWAGLRVDLYTDANLTVPDLFRWPSKKGAAEPLVIKQRSSKNVVFEPKTPIEGRLYAAKDASHTGIWNYFWWPDKKIAKSDLAGLDPLDKGIDKDLIKYIMQAPVSTKPKLRPGAAPIPVRQQEHMPVLRRKAPSARKVKETDPFDYPTWKKAHEKYTAMFNQLDQDAAFPAFKGMMLALDVHQRLKRRVTSSLPAVPSDPMKEYKRYKQADFWTGPSSKPIGLMRHWFGGAFIKVAKIYNGIREKLQSRLKGKTSRGGKSGILGTALKVAFKLLKLVGAVVVRKTMNELVNSLVIGVQNKLKALLDPEKLLGLLLDEERKAELDEKIKQIKELQKSLEEKVVKTAEELIEKIIGPYATYLEAIENVHKVVSNIMTIVNWVRWGARVIACLSPPAWGCLWILGEAVLEHFAGLVIETCWFQKKITPLINKVKFVMELPKFLAGEIIKILKEHVLPVQLHDVFADPATISVGDVSFDEVECEESADGRYPLTPEREELLKLQERLGEEKFKRLMALIQAAQVPSDKKLSVQDIQKLGDFADKASIDDLKKYAKNYNQAPKGGIVDLKTFLDNVKKPAAEAEPTSEGAEKPAAGGAEKPSTEAGQGAAKEGEEGIQVIDSEKAKVVSVPSGLKWDGKAVGLVLNPRWKHHYSETTIYKVDIRFYEDNFKGRPLFIIRDVEAKVLKGGRRWLDPEKKSSLLITYTTQFTYRVGTIYLKKGGTCIGVVDASAKF